MNTAPPVDEMQESLAALEAQPVEQGELPDIAQQQQPAAPPAMANVPGASDPASAAPLPIMIAPKSQPAGQLPGVATGIDETSRSELLTVTAPQPDASDLYAYADPGQNNGLYRYGLGDPNGGSFVIGSETIPHIDPAEQAALARIPALHASIDHGQCHGGRGPAPQQMGARRVNPGDPYYIEIRMRQTPLMPVGHTYVAYGRLDGSGEIMDESLIMLAPLGGYVGAAIASGVPMPGVLKPHPDDCRIRPDLAYRVSLNARQYEKLLLEIREAKIDTPSYLLFQNNCNHFMTRIAASVGIRPPDNIYVPAVRYLHDMIEANEGIRVARR